MKGQLRGGWVQLFFALLTCAMLAFVVVRWKFSTDISEFLPTGENRELAELSAAIAQSELSRTLIVSVKGRNATQSIAAARLFEQEVRRQSDWQSLFSFVEGGPPLELQASLFELYQPRRLGFVAPDVQAAQHLVSDVGLREALAALRLALSSPLSAVIARVAPDDPFLAVPSLLRTMQEQERSLEIVDDRYLAKEMYGIVLLGSRASAFDAPAQMRLLVQVDRAMATVKVQMPEVQFESSGLARFSVSAANSIRADISRISWLSALSLGVLCLLLFRSLRLVVLTLVPVSFGMLAGIAALLATEGSIHGLTLAFGASLIGVCVDYVIHYYVHYLDRQAGQTPRATMKRIGRGLFLGAATTVVGFAVLAGSNFPGLGQAAIFGAVGIAAALAITYWLLPSMMPSQTVEVPLRLALGLRLESIVCGLAVRPRAVAVGGLLAVVFAVWGGLSIRWDDNMSGLTRFDPQLRQESERVRNRVASFEQSQFIVAVGESNEQALKVNDAVASSLQRAVGNNELSSFQGLGHLLPSADSQRKIAQVVTRAQLPTRLPPLLEQAGFDSQAFAPFFRMLEQGQFEPLTFADWSSSEAAPLVRSFRIELGSQVGVVTFLRGVVQPQALAQRMAELPGAWFVDQSALMQGANRGYRKRVVGLMGLGLALVLLVLWGRYRSIQFAFAAFAPALLAGAVTVSVLSLLGVALNLLGLTALLMVLSIGVDYGVFLTESELLFLRDEEDSPSSSLAATLTGLFVACLSTVFGFGVLGLSVHPALNTIGLTAAIGVTVSLLFAPLSLVLLGRFFHGRHTRVR